MGIAWHSEASCCKQCHGQWPPEHLVAGRDAGAQRDAEFTHAKGGSTAFQPSPSAEQGKDGETEVARVLSGDRDPKVQATVVMPSSSDDGPCEVAAESLPCNTDPAEFDWEVVVKRTRTDRALGLGLFSAGNELLVESIGLGMLEKWNLAHPDFEVRRGAVILAVNGESGNPKTLFEKLQNDAVVHLKLKRVPNLEVTIEKRGKLGLEVSNITLEVLQVKDDGAIDLHNRTCKPGHQMVPGDLIVGVNGIRDDIPTMLKEIYTSPTVAFTIARDWD